MTAQSTPCRSLCYADRVHIRPLESTTLDEATALVAAPLAWDPFAPPGRKVRVADHPGNYLTPGIDPRYEAGLAFLRARGFEQVGSERNLRVPLSGNRKTTRVHAERLAVRCAAAGYQVRRALAAD